MHWCEVMIIRLTLFVVKDAADRVFSFLGVVFGRGVPLF